MSVMFRILHATKLVYVIIKISVSTFHSVSIIQTSRLTPSKTLFTKIFAVYFHTQMPPSVEKEMQNSIMIIGVYNN